jgi:quercetin dioxygenase-like cupin family protein
MENPKGKSQAVVCTNLEVPKGVHEFETGDAEPKPPNDDPLRRVIYIDDRIIPGSFYVEAVWVVGSVPKSHPEHTHPDHDEILGFVSSNMDNPNELGAEIDLVVDGKKMTITKTCFIHVPAGVKHGGLCFRKIERPVFQIAMSRMPAFSSVPPT